MRVSSTASEILRGGETTHVEFKSSVSKPDVIGREVCAFLNAGGGTVVIGVDDRGKPVGVKSPQSLGEKIQEDLLANLAPRVFWSVTPEEIEGKQLLLVDVPEGVSKPYAYRGKMYVRKGATTRSVSRADIRTLIDSRSSEGTRWERMATPGVEPAHLDEDEILRTAGDAVRRRYFKFRDSADVEAILHDLGLVGSGLVLNSGAVLFCPQVGRVYPQTRVRFVVFDDESRRTLRDNRFLEGHAFHLLEEVEQLLRLHLPIRAELPDQGYQRTDTPAVPFSAVREAALNAIIHRDYMAFDGSITISVYRDRIEFWNSGELPKGMTVEDLKGSHVSRPQNPDIAHVFFLRGHIERVGLGTGQIVSECLGAGMPEPEWKLEAGGVKLTLGFSRGISKAMAGGKEQVLELNPRQIALLERLKPGEEISPSDYVASLEERVSVRTARKDLYSLTEAGYLSRRGKSYNTTYLRTGKESKT